MIPTLFNHNLALTWTHCDLSEPPLHFPPEPTDLHETPLQNSRHLLVLITCQARAARAAHSNSFQVAETRGHALFFSLATLQMWNPYVTAAMTLQWFKDKKDDCIKTVFFNR